jgi:hypothetical protein
LFVFDLFGTTVDDGYGRKIDSECVDSLPFGEFWKGMIESDVIWKGSDQQIDAPDLWSMLTGMTAMETDPEDSKSYAVITPEYLNLKPILGCYYMIMGCYPAENSYKNYISLLFQGGVAETKKGSCGFS